MAEKYTCPIDGCGLEVERVYGDPSAAHFAEEYILPLGKTLDDMPKSAKGHPLPLGVQRNILMECSVHGRRYILKMGHHASVKTK
jgi:hypothetical protein